MESPYCLPLLGRGFHDLQRTSNKHEMVAVERDTHSLAMVGSNDFLYYFDPDAAIKVIWIFETFIHLNSTQAKAKGNERLSYLSDTQK